MVNEGCRAKPEGYYSGLRRQFVDCLPLNPAARLLEIGCGEGATGAYALQQKKCCWCCGVELCPEVARQAQGRLSQVITGDIERLDLPFATAFFDVVLISEVLEHLVDPWSVLRKVRRHMKPGAVIVAGSPNVAHYSVLLMLLRGEWRYAGSGIMDRTHLRWFTLRTYREMFESCGFTVEFVRPAVRIRGQARWANLLALGKLEHLLARQIVLKATC